MKITAGLIANILGADLEGDADVEILGPGRIEEGKKGDISFLSNLKYEKYIYDTKASVILVSRSFVPSGPISATLIKVDNVDESLLILMKQFAKKTNNIPANIHPTAIIHESAQIGDNVGIGAYSIIGERVKIAADTIIASQVTIDRDTVIGNGVRIDAGVRIYHATEIGNQCVIKANTVVGGEGFGYTKGTDGSYERLPHLGKVILYDRVELGSCVTVDRGSIGNTVLHTGVKIDNLVQIAHNVELGAHTAIAAQAGLAGSAKVGSGVQIGGQTAIVGHIKIADNVMIQGQAGVAKTIKEVGSKWYGTPAISYNNYLRSFSIFKKLPEIAKQIEELKK